MANTILETSFFIITVTIFLFFNYKKNVFSKIYLSGIPGLIGGIILGIGLVVMFLPCIILQLQILILLSRRRQFF